ncbi:MAG: DNA translocase FtsK [Candidatus Marinimicrobia bacterium]|nr:DNA translocase FtsK [Candidatus Neomarinimicrobiota bacterium]
MTVKKKQERRKEVIGLLFMALAVLVAASMLSYDMSEEPNNITELRTSNYLGIGGVFVSHYLIKMFLGLGSSVIPLLLLLWGWWIFSGKKTAALTKFTLFLSIMALLFSTFSALIIGKSWAVPGAVGGVLAGFLTTFLGIFGAWIFIGLALILLTTGYFGWSIYGLTESIKMPFRMLVESVKRLKKDRKRKVKREIKEDIYIPEESIEEEEWNPPEVMIEKELTESQPQSNGGSTEKEVFLSEEESTVSAITNETETLVEESAEKNESAEYTVTDQIVENEIDYDAEREEYAKREYNFPSVDLLESPPKINEDQISREEIMDKAKLLEETLESFKVSAKVIEVHPGPVITRFELEPAPGVKVNKIVSLSDDIALALRAKRVRIIAPIPGKAAVGVEIPNKKTATVYMKSIINSEKFASSDSPLTIALGKTSSGEIICVDLATMPHLLIAGSTGSGKSVCINSIITSMLYKARPDELKFIMIDPKKIELSIYKKLKGYHLMPMRDVKEDIITSPHLAVLALKSAEVEMERRYDLLADLGVRGIVDYNNRAEASGDFPKIPYIVIVIDELADLMITAAKDIEEPISRLAQMARAVGIHLIVATQRPSVDVLTGVIKANFPARMAFQVATKTDSRTIIDMNGADKLLGKGDMLYLPSTEPEAIRVHNSFISLPEIENLLNHINEQPKYEEKPLPSMKEAPLRSDGEGYLEFFGNDSLLPEAMRLVVTHQQGSVSLLQRRLRVGYSRAARLIDELENAGVVGKFEGSKAREVLWDEADLKKNLENETDEDNN